MHRKGTRRREKAQGGGGCAVLARVLPIRGTRPLPTSFYTNKEILNTLPPTPSAWGLWGESTTGGREELGGGRRWNGARGQGWGTRALRLLR
jgi:hypothetical protein